MRYHLCNELINDVSYEFYFWRKKRTISHLCFIFINDISFICQRHLRFVIGIMNFIFVGQWAHSNKKTWRFGQIALIEIRTCLCYRFCNKHLPSSHHPIFFCLVSHSTSNHIQRLMLQSVPYRICNVVLSSK